MSEIGEEEIARAILHEEYGLSPEEAPNLYAKALSTGRLVMALLHPALERARVEGALACRVMGERIFDELVARGVDPDLIADAFEKLADESDAEVAAIRKG